MTQAEPAQEAVIVPVNAGKARVNGMLFGAMTLLFGVPTIGAIIAGLVFEFPTVLGLVATVLFGALAVTYLGLSRRRPVALRMDAHGISGWYTAPATWDEIAKISVLEGPKGNNLLAFALHDPIAFRDRQSPWQRLTSHTNGKSNGHHIVISEMLLKDVTAADLRPKAERRQAAASERAQQARASESGANTPK